MKDHPVLGVYMLSDKPISKNAAQLMGGGLMVSLSFMRNNGWDGQMNYADIIDPDRFPTLQDAMLPYIVSIDGAQYLTGKPDNTAVIIHDAQSVPGQAFQICVIVEGRLEQFSSTREVFPDLYSETGRKQSGKTKASVGASAEATLAQGRKLEETRRYRDAFQLYEEALKSNDDIEIARRMSRVSLMLDDQRRNSAAYYMNHVMTHIKSPNDLTADDYTTFVRGLYECWKVGDVSRFSGLTREVGMPLEELMLTLIGNARSLGGADPALAEIEKATRQKGSKLSSFFKRKT